MCINCNYNLYKLYGYSENIFTIFIVGFVLFRDKLDYLHPEYSETKDLLIQSAYSSSSQELHGSFILGCGTISGSATSKYIIRGIYPQGVKRMELYANNVYVNETDKESPRIKQYYTRTIQPGYSSKWLLLDRKKYISNWKTKYIYSDIILIVPINNINSTN